MSRLIFTISDAERDALDSIRDALALRSSAEAVRELIHRALADPKIMGSEAVAAARPVPKAEVRRASAGFRPSPEVAPGREHAPRLPESDGRRAAIEAVEVYDPAVNRQRFLDRQKGKK